MNIKRLVLYVIIGFIPVVILFIYILFVTSTTDWKQNLGTFGDSFGVVNALFTGLTFAGLIINLLQQREEIKNQQEDLLESRKEFKRSADAQERTAKLTAYSDLLKEYNDKIKILEIQISETEKQRNANLTASDHIRMVLQNSKPDKNPRTDKLEELKEKKNKILAELEKSLQDSGINP